MLLTFLFKILHKWLFSVIVRKKGQCNIWPFTYMANHDTSFISRKLEQFETKTEVQYELLFFIFIQWNVSQNNFYLFFLKIRGVAQIQMRTLILRSDSYIFNSYFPLMWWLARILKVVLFEFFHEGAKVGSVSIFR